MPPQDNTYMPDKFLWEKTIEALNKSVEANQASAAANTKNAEATEKLQRLVEQQQQISENLVHAIEGLGINTKDIVKGLETVAANQKITNDVTQKEKEKYFKYLLYAVVLIIIILGGGVALKAFFGFDLTSLIK